MPLGKRQVFVYWRVALADTPPAMQAMRDLQRRLQDSHPGLRARLYVRSETSADDTTLMETYSVDAGADVQGLDAVLQRHIDDAGAALLRPWLRGARHVEVFESCDE